MAVIIYNWKEQVGLTVMVENPPFFYPNCNFTDKSGFLNFSEIEGKSSKIKVLNDFD